MSEFPKISVVIIAQDEERTIGDVLKAAAPLAAELILVDSGSTDRTIEIAVGLGANVSHQDWLGYSAQKNYALSLASCPWILSLDADEVLSDSLVEEITITMGGPGLSKVDGFSIPRLLYIGNRPVRFGGFYPDAQMRLFKNGFGKFNDRRVHESIVLNGNSGSFKNPLRHLAYTNLDDFAKTLDRYARLSAEENLRTGRLEGFKLSLINLLLHPFWTFFYRFVFRLGFLDGIFGLKLNLLYADYVRKKIAYLREAVISSRQS